jgi:hypothetical protein
MGATSLRHWILGVVAALGAAGCSMRVTGVVRDATTKNPIGGAVVSAEDGRGRHYSTDPRGFYNLKTDWDPSTLVFGAPGYQPRTVSVGDQTRWQVVDVELEREIAAAGVPPAPASRP